MQLAVSYRSSRVAVSGGRRARPSAVCSAVSDDHAARRAVLLGGFMPVALTAALPALALIPDEEDEELLEKAKANRQKRLAEQSVTTREFIKAEGLKDVKLDKDLIPVQKAVYKLAKSGSELESGDVKAASATLNEPWSSEFAAAAAKVGSNPDSVVAKITSLKAAANKGDAPQSKREFVALVSELKSWASSSNLEAKLKGL